MAFKNGDAVAITDAHGKTTLGTLFLPDREYLVRYGKMGEYSRLEKIPQTLCAGYGVATLILENGNRFRTEGRLSRAQ